ncbi:MAG: phosphoglycerate kinase [Candidatus Micrarchaeota archaeon]|nr:phosphoglycerate kinase [Candidatus Micrarchaeota archaeon]
MLTLDSCNFLGKTAFVRVDLNSPVDEKTLAVEKSERISGHAQTVRELSDKGARVVVLAHQGRKGDYDCISLSQHALLLGSEVKKPVRFVDDVCGKKAKDAIRSLSNGDILLLDNVRFLDDETKYKTIEENAKAKIVRELSPYCDVFVLDAFSAAHRAQASIVGFYKKPVVAGRVMERELDALNRLKEPKHPSIFIFGGAKADDSIGIMEHLLSEGKMDCALTCGVPGELFILASGKELGRTLVFLKEKKALEHLPKAREMLEKYKGRIMFPSDVAVDDGGKRKEIGISSLPSKHSIMDIGKKTVKLYEAKIAGAATVMMNGPAGVYENDEFSYGTRSLLKAIEGSQAFSVFGGGHTLSALDKFRIDKKRLGYVSLAGKALIEYLSGDELPGVKIVEDSSPGDMGCGC